ncbi:MAG: Uma2 family endonuclease [Myxococcales bacterium]|nr:Uma2 family endonuclease [Myxococcales bacterium]
MHVRSPRPSHELSADPRNSEARGADLPPPTPPEGGWSAWYLTDEDDVGESTEQGITVRMLLAALTELARERGWARSLVAGDQFFAWVPREPLVRISPDVYLLDDPPPPPYPGMWHTWLPGHAPPRFAVEVVSEKWKKDYEAAPRKYDQLGARELVVFDPEAAQGPGRDDRTPLQVFRRGDDGAFTCAAAGPGPVHSVELDAWLVVTPGPRLRIARDPAGADLVATPDEQLAATRRENTALRRENADLRARVATLEETLETQAERIAEQDRIIAAQAATIAAQAATIAAQAARIAELEAKVAALEAKLTLILEQRG